MSVIVFSTSTVESTSLWKASAIKKIGAVAAPNAITRALAAAIDFSNSLAFPVMRPSGSVKVLELNPCINPRLPPLLISFPKTAPASLADCCTDCISGKNFTPTSI